MPSFDKMWPDQPEEAVVPLPKVNVPPRERDKARLIEEEVPEIEAPRIRPSALREELPTLAPKTRSSAVRWDARFALSLVALLVVVNLSLVLLFGRQEEEPQDVFVTEVTPAPVQPHAPDTFNQLAPAGGTGARSSYTRKSETTTYISDDERKALLKQLQQTRQPGIVSLPPAAPAANQ